MKNSIRITLCGLTAALAATITLAAYFPYITYAAPAIAGLMMLIPIIEINCKWAWGCYAASILPVFLMAEPEAKIMYIFLFGWYPIAKAVIERINRRWLEWIIKIIAFNAAVLFVYGVLAGIMNISVEEFGEFGKYSIYIFLAVGNAAFIFYDMAISQIANIYMLRVHPHIKKFFKVK